MRNNKFPKNINFDGFADKCPLCGKKMNLISAQMIEKRDNSPLLFVVCNHCKGAVMIAIVNDAFGVASLGIMTDMSLEDVEKFRGKKGITSDEVLDLHLLAAGKKAISEKASVK
ncbi:MAG: hypothetical protein V1698_03320 [bacterium]